MSRTKVLVVEDHPITRNALKDLLGDCGLFDIAGVFDDGDEAIRAGGDLEPDVIVPDVIMPRKDGINACREDIGLLPETRVLMLTASTEEDAVLQAVAARASVYLLKYSEPDDLVLAILDVAEGRLRFHDHAVGKVFAMLRGKPGVIFDRPSDKLTALELETVKLFASGTTYAEIARAGQQRRDGSQQPLPRPGKVWNQDEAGACLLGSPERPVGRCRGR